MKKLFFALCIFFISLISFNGWGVKALNSTKSHVLLISVDGLRSDFIYDPEKYGIKLPVLQRLVENGTYASRGAEPVFPTVTYPNHQSIITGRNPVSHGIDTNRVFDPEEKHMGAWQWYVSDKVPNLWETAKKNGYLTVNIGFPTSVSADADYNIPDYWRDKTELDSKVIDAVSRPQGIVKEIEEQVIRGHYPGYDWDLPSDRKRHAAQMYILDRIKRDITKKPLFMTAYFASYDEHAHIDGTLSKQAVTALEEIDKMIGELIKEAKEITKGNIIIAIVSDHGMTDLKGILKPNVQLYKEGLLKVDEKGNVTEWDAYFQASGGAGQIKLKNPNNKAVRHKVEAILNKMKNDPSGTIIEVMTGEEAITKYKGFPNADYVLVSSLGYEFKEDILGDYFRNETTPHGGHGFLPQYPEMKASFIIEGVNIPRNNDVGEVQLIDVAPTLAKIMGFDLPSSEGKDIFSTIKNKREFRK